MIHAQKGTDSIVVAPQAMTNSATVTANLDTVGGDYASIRIALASEVNTNAVGPTLSVLTSDDTVVTNFATIVADRSAEDITAAKVVTYHVDTRKHKRYLRLSVTTATTTNDDVTVAAIGSISRKEVSPSTTGEMADAAVVV
jgi:hypothetical protein